MFLTTTYGDVCKLGYLKWISTIASDFDPLSKDYLSSRLVGLAGKERTWWHLHKKETGGFREFRRIGIINPNAPDPISTAKRHLNLASEIGITTSKGNLGIFGRIYKRTKSASGATEFVKDPDHYKGKPPLTLDRPEQVLFLSFLIMRDGLSVQELIRLIPEEGEIRKSDVVYRFKRDSLRKILKALLNVEKDPQSRDRIRRRLWESENYGNKSRMYLYRHGGRHLAPPRIEWLCDLGLLKVENEGERSSIISTSGTLFKQARRKFDSYMNKWGLSSIHEFGFDSIYILGEVYLHADKDATEYEIKDAMLRAYEKFEKDSYLMVHEDQLAALTVLQLALSRKRCRVSSVKEVAKRLRESSCLAYSADFYGRPTFWKIDVEKARLL